MRTPHHSIGDVLNELRDEFPDITISKIRFLESQGLIAPERTASGYRKFYAADVARLRWILRQQKEHFLPLKVIKDRLDTLDPAELDAAFAGQGELDLDRSSREEAVQALFEAARREAAEVQADRVAAAVGEAADGPNDDHDAGLGDLASGVSLTRAELVAAAGLDDGQLSELEAYGLLQPLRTGTERALFGEEALVIARVAAGFMRFGIEARHLRMYRAFTEREVSLFDQVLLPYHRQRNPEAQAKVEELQRELAGLGRRLRAGLLQQTLRQQAR
jgi:DNA-binding transcriptional MerR regulator